MEGSATACRGSTGGLGTRLEGIMRRIHIAMPMDGQALEPFIPDSVKNVKKYAKDDPNRPKTAREIEQENGGAGVYNVDLRAEYLLKDDSWKYDKIPEISNGKNVADYIDPDIEAKLEALEQEEARLEEKGFYQSEEEDIDTE